MMKKIQSIALAALLLLSSVQAFSQAGRVKQADQYFADYAFAKALEFYQMAFDAGEDSLTHAHKVAESYTALRNPEKACEWYGYMEDMQSELSAQEELNFSEALKGMGQYAQASLHMQRYLDQQIDDRRAKMMLEAGDYIASLTEFPDRYTVKNLAINTEQSEFGPSWLGDGLVFASAGLSEDEKVYEWNNEPFLDLYMGMTQDGGDLIGVSDLSTTINSEYHEGPCTFTPDAERIYFSRNNFYKGKAGKDAEQTIRLKIYSADKQGAEWGEVQEFAYNGEDFSTSHPSLTKDGKRMYFASDREGGEGGTDIWYCDLDGSGEWGIPTNAGVNVNTEGDEMFPYVHSDSNLYFASTGHLGLGGLDIVMGEFTGAGFKMAQNLGAPINTAADDFGFILDKTGEAGYLSSNRQGGVGKDDIYYFSLNKESEAFTPTLEGEVVALKDEKGLKNATVRLLDGDGMLVEEVETDKKGAFVFELPKEEKDYRLEISYKDQWSEFESKAITAGSGQVDIGNIPLDKLNLAARGTVRSRETNNSLPGFDVILTDQETGESYTKTTTSQGGVLFSLDKDKHYHLRFEKEGFFAKTAEISTVDMKEGVVDIEKFVDLYFEELVIGKAMSIDNIYYDYNEFNIRPDAAAELDKVIKIMEDNPNIIIEMGSHTDVRGKEDYNQALSENRAREASAYMLTKGIIQDRITYKGYGETLLINHCVEDTECSDEEHEKNRRTEFKVIGLLMDTAQETP